MEAARENRIDMVLAEALDRLSRDQADIATIYKRLVAWQVPLEGEFEDILRDVQPSQTLMELARAMFANAWNMQLANARERAKSITLKIIGTDKQISTYLDRIVDASNPTVFERIQERIAKLEKEKLILEEKQEAEGQPIRPFDEMFELSMRFLSNPWNIWRNGRLEHKRTVLKLTFEERLQYDRNQGFQTPKTTIVFKALEGLRTGKFRLSEGEEPGSNLLLASSRCHGGESLICVCRVAPY